MSVALVSDAQLEAVLAALCGLDAFLASRGGCSNREMVGAIVGALATAPGLQTPSEQCAAAVSLEKERIAAACKAVLDEREESRAYTASREAAGKPDELDRLRHWATVCTFNAGVRRCISAVLAA